MMSANTFDTPTIIRISTIAYFWGTLYLPSPVQTSFMDGP